MWIPEIFSDNEMGDIHYHEPLSLHSTWRIGGPADIFIEPRSIDHITQIVKIAHYHKIPLVVIGNGSNILFNDNGIRGIVIKLGNMFSRHSIDGTIVTVQAGAYVPDLVQVLAAVGLSGMEHAAGIPGSIGGLVYMNGGSQGQSVGDVVHHVQVMDKFGDISWMPGAECGFSYRKSCFQQMDGIICEVELRLKKKEKHEIQKDIADILARRAQKIPTDLPSCGSVFLSDPTISSTGRAPGRLIEEAGLKGYRVGGAEVSGKHGNFIINAGNATARDVVQLVDHIRNKVLQFHSQTLHCEIRYIDENGNSMSLDEANC